MSESLRLELWIAHDWDCIDPVREAVAHCLSAVSADKDLTDALSMVSAELLENAVKYGKPEPRGIFFSLHTEGDHIVIAVTNSVEAQAAHVGALLAQLAWLHTFADPADAYRTVLESMYKQENDAAAISRLGIVRIAYEGGCRLDCDTSEPGRVTVRAVYVPSRVPSRPAAAA